MNGPNGLMIHVAYTDTVGERKVIEKEVAINGLLNTGSEMPSGKTGRIQQNAFETYKWYIVGSIILITGLVFYSKYRRKKLIDPQFKIKDFFFRELKKLHNFVVQKITGNS
ncbi:MAG: hypothetical protein DRP37_05420 [Thermodesulfobacteriota bacterium]|nr:MAG: hypothetical protein DRP37_05420 [Thermodesulfobacteriota bacterium]